jgi:serine/threonine-protein kinase
MPLQTGQVINNRYRIAKLLGQGGFGAVYRAWDMNIEASCALKENLDTTPEAQKQFRREAVILANLQHPNLPRVRDHFIIQGQGQYLVMDFVEGEDLQQMLDKQGGPLPESQVLPWIEQVCEALTYLHNQHPPIIHRDIKPANIKITPQGRAMLVDFGIAKVFDPHLSTTRGARAVTPGYSPQEQYGQGKTDARSDVYALGATLYALLTGVEPVESLQRVFSDPLTAPEGINPTITPKTADTIRQAMQPDPAQRY